MTWELKIIEMDTIQNFFISKVKLKFFKVKVKTASATKVKFYPQGNEKALSKKSFENEVNSCRHGWKEVKQHQASLFLE